MHILSLVILGVEKKLIKIVGEEERKSGLGSHHGAHRWREGLRRGY